MRPYKIVIIEDDFIIQSELRTLLVGNGYDVFIVTDFSKTIQQIKENAPHLILLDIKLPQENGFTLCSQIRSFSNVPIIFVTSCNTDMDELNSIMLGGDAFITKPYNTAILLAKISSLLKRTYPTNEQETLDYHGVVLHLDSGKIEYTGQQADLTSCYIPPWYSVCNTQYHVFSVIAIHHYQQKGRKKVIIADNIIWK